MRFHSNNVRSRYKSFFKIATIFILVPLYMTKNLAAVYQLEGENIDSRLSIAKPSSSSSSSSSRSVVLAGEKIPLHFNPPGDAGFSFFDEDFNIALEEDPSFCSPGVEAHWEKSK